MSRIKLLLDVVQDLRSLADSLQTVADAMTQGDTSEEAAPAAPAPVTETPPARKVTLEEVRAVLAEKSHDGLTDQVRDLLQKYGAEKLSAIDPKDYEALLKDAEVLGHAT